jgi:hypothetical protein
MANSPVEIYRPVECSYATQLVSAVRSGILQRDGEENSRPLLKYYSHNCGESWDSAVRIGTGYWLDGRGVGCLSL